MTDSRPVPWPTDEQFIVVIAATQRQGDRQILLALRLHDLEPDNPAGAYPGHKRLAALTGLTAGYIRKRLSAMVQSGRLCVRRRGRLASYYITTCSPQRELANDTDTTPTCSPQREHVSSRENTNKQPDMFPLERTPSAGRVPHVFPTCSPQSATGKGKGTTNTWLSPFFEAWVNQYGGEPSGGQLAKALKPLVDDSGTDEVLRRWTDYLRSTPAAFASPSRFRQTFGSWNTKQSETLRNLQEMSA